MKDDIEYRSIADVNLAAITPAEGEKQPEMRIEGVAARIGVKNLIYTDQNGVPFYECILPHALDDVDLSDVLLRYNHNDSTPILARGKNGSMNVILDNDVLRIKATFMDTATARDLYKLIQEKAAGGLSIGFSVAKDYYSKNTRYIEKIEKLTEISVVDIPAYKNTSIKVQRSFDKLLKDETEHKKKIKIRTYL